MAWVEALVTLLAVTPAALTDLAAAPAPAAGDAPVSDDHLSAGSGGSKPGAGSRPDERAPAPAEEDRALRMHRFGIPAHGRSLPPDVAKAGAAGLSILLAFVLLWHRLDRDRLPEHPLRARVLDTLQRGPATLGFLARSFGTSKGTLRHHLDHLVRARLVQRTVFGPCVWYHLPGLALEDAVLVAVRSDPGIHVGEVARRAGLPPSSARRRLRTLQQQGRVRIQRTGGVSRVFPAVRYE